MLDRLFDLALGTLHHQCDTCSIAVECPLHDFLGQGEPDVRAVFPLAVENLMNVGRDRSPLGSTRRIAALARPELVRRQVIRSAPLWTGLIG
ncbi:MAG: hypothetical protein KGR26_04535 [Cyanobacteria bacterium REEB65]|nr:hypothetical protein [Cyanobacteria bacterium REEB65]